MARRERCLTVRFTLPGRTNEASPTHLVQNRNFPSPSPEKPMRYGAIHFEGGFKIIIRNMERVSPLGQIGKNTQPMILLRRHPLFS